MNSNKQSMILRMRDTSALPLLLLSHNCNKIGRKKRVSFFFINQITEFYGAFAGSSPAICSLIQTLGERRFLKYNSSCAPARWSAWNDLLDSNSTQNYADLRLISLLCVNVNRHQKNSQQKKNWKNSNVEVPKWEKKELKSRDLSSRSRLNGVLLFGEEREQRRQQHKKSN